MIDVINKLAGIFFILLGLRGLFFPTQWNKEIIDFQIRYFKAKNTEVYETYQFWGIVVVAIGFLVFGIALFFDLIQLNSK